MKAKPKHFFKIEFSISILGYLSSALSLFFKKKRGNNKRRRGKNKKGKKTKEVKTHKVRENQEIPKAGRVKKKGRNTKRVEKPRNPIQRGEGGKGKNQKGVNKTKGEKNKKV